MSKDSKSSSEAFDQTEESIRINKAARKILSELEDAGIIDFEEEMRLEAEAKKPEGLSGEMLLKIFAISAGTKSHEEVERATRLIGSRKLTCNQAKVICQNFHYGAIHSKPFLTGIMLNISDPENVSGLARAVLSRSNGSARAFIEKFELVTSSEFERREPEASTVKEVVTVTKRLNLPAKIGLASIPIMILIIIVLMGIIIL